MARGRRLTLDLMETLVTVVECGGNGQEAAGRLGIGQPTMSKRLALLQHSSQVARYPYLEKHGKTWRLTEEGRRRIDAIGDIVRLDRLLRRDADERIARAPDLAIACGQLAVRTLVLPALGELRRERPDIRLRVSTPRGRDRIVGVANGRFDLALVTHEPEEVHRIARRTMHVEKLFDDPWVVVCGRKSPRFVRRWFDELPAENVRLKALAGPPLVLPEPNAGLRLQLDRASVAAGIQDELQITMEIGGWTTLLDAVRDGYGLGLVTRTALSGEVGLLPEKCLHPRDLPNPAVRLVSRAVHADESDLVGEVADHLARLAESVARA